MLVNGIRAGKKGLPMESFDWWSVGLGS